MYVPLFCVTCSLVSPVSPLFFLPFPPFLPFLPFPFLPYLSSSWSSSPPLLLSSSPSPSSFSVIIIYVEALVSNCICTVDPKITLFTFIYPQNLASVCLKKIEHLFCNHLKYYNYYMHPMLSLFS